MKYISHSEKETFNFAKKFAGTLRGGEVIGLIGDLGAGKTVFTKGLAAGLGVEQVITSPTFVLMKIYQAKNKKAEKQEIQLVHIDAYRLEKGSELASLGFDELMQDASNLILLEWPEKIADTLPKPMTRISIVTNTDDSRTISYG